MTEAEWLACTDPSAMIHFLATRKHWRKVRLFACACCRRVEHWLVDETIGKALLSAERYADGLIKSSTAQTWYRKAYAARDSLPKSSDLTPNWLAYHAVCEAVVGDPYEAYLYTHTTVAQCLARVSGAATGSAAWEAAIKTELNSLSKLLRDLIGNPFQPVMGDPVCHSSVVRNLAASIYADRTFDHLPILADALEEAGCTDADILGHCRSPGPHVRGCWVVDLILGKA